MLYLLNSFPTALEVLAESDDSVSASFALERLLDIMGKRTLAVCSWPNMCTFVFNDGLRHVAIQRRQRIDGKRPEYYYSTDEDGNTVKKMRLIPFTDWKYTTVQEMEIVLNVKFGAYLPDPTRDALNSLGVKITDETGLNTPIQNRYLSVHLQQGDKAYKQGKTYYYWIREHPFIQSTDDSVLNVLQPWNDETLEKWRDVFNRIDGRFSL